MVNRHLHNLLDDSLNGDNLFTDDLNLLWLLLDMVDNSLHFDDFLNLDDLLDNSLYFDDFRYLLSDINDLFDDCWHLNDLMNDLLNGDNFFHDLSLYHRNLQWYVYDLLNLDVFLYFDNLLNLLRYRDHHGYFHPSLYYFLNNLFNLNDFWDGPEHSQDVVDIDNPCDLCGYHSQDSLIDL
jgi:hypothetical protein